MHSRNVQAFVIFLCLVTVVQCGFKVHLFRPIFLIIGVSSRDVNFFNGVRNTLFNKHERRKMGDNSMWLALAKNEVPFGWSVQILQGASGVLNPHLKNFHPPPLPKNDSKWQFLGDENFLGGGFNTPDAPCSKYFPSFKKLLNVISANNLCCIRRHLNFLKSQGEALVNSVHNWLPSGRYVYGFGRGWLGTKWPGLNWIRVIRNFPVPPSIPLQFARDLKRRHKKLP